MFTFVPEPDLLGPQPFVISNRSAPSTLTSLYDRDASTVIEIGLMDKNRFVEC